MLFFINPDCLKLAEQPVVKKCQNCHCCNNFDFKKFDDLLEKKKIILMYSATMYENMTYIKKNQLSV